jgi:phosphotransferase system enzyme I (PtsI)
MSFAVHGLAVSRGVAIGRAVIVSSSRLDVAHYFVAAEQCPAEIERLREARNAVADEIGRVQSSLHDLGSHDAHPELAALLDVHLMLLQDEQLVNGVKRWRLHSGGDGFGFLLVDAAGYVVYPRIPHRL